MSNLLDVIRKNIEFVGISLLLMVIVFVIARASEVLIEKRNGVKFASKNTKVNKTVNYGYAVSNSGYSYVL